MSDNKEIALTPMKRWTPEKLLEVKVYLETKAPSLFTREDHYLVVDYLAMRYLPEDDNRTEEEWQAARTKLHRKIDLNIDHPDRPKEPVIEDPDFADWLRNHLSKR